MFSKEKQLDFTEAVLNSRPLQPIENLASESHETHRYPDPYIFVVHLDELYTPNGTRVKDAMEKASYLGNSEYTAFLELERFSFKHDSGLAVWFSPPYPGYYPNSKIIVSENISSRDGTKILFNRAMVLDVEADELFRLANELSSDMTFDSVETLRSHLVFPTDKEFVHWFSRFRSVTNQAEEILLGHDLYVKKETYARLSDIYASIPYYKDGNDFYARMYEVADKNGFIDKNPSSCPIMFSTPFETVASHSFDLGEAKTFECTCPYCNQKVTAIIKNGKIFCTNPQCKEGKKGVKYNC